MKAYQLLAKLRLLTLAGTKDGQLEWIGTDTQWSQVPLEEESILRDWELKQDFDPTYEDDQRKLEQLMGK